LHQNKEDHLYPLEAADGLRLLVFSAMEAMQPLLNTIDQEARRDLLTRIFDKGYISCHKVPTYFLDLSLTGKFWIEIEHALSGEYLSKVAKVYAKG
jgi:hypothetical protein